jgi:RNA polymerase sigma factor (sigma-70 family)
MPESDPRKSDATKSSDSIRRRLTQSDAERDKLDWEAYRADPRGGGGTEALGRLLERHQYIIKHVAARFVGRGPHKLEFDDCLGLSRLGAIHAYDNFDPRKNAALSSWVYYIAPKYVMAHEEPQNLVRCPPRVVPLRNYILGRFDGHPEMRKRIEAQYGISTVEEGYILYGALAPLAPLDAPVGVTDADGAGKQLERRTSDARAPSADAIIENVVIRDALQSITQQEQRLLALIFIEDLSREEAARVMDLRVHQVGRMVLHARKRLKSRVERCTG